MDLPLMHVPQPSYLALHGLSFTIIMVNGVLEYYLYMRVCACMYMCMFDTRFHSILVIVINIYLIYAEIIHY